MRFLTKLMDIRFRAEKEPVSARANTGIERGLVMLNHQARGGLIGIPPLDKLLFLSGGVYCRPRLGAADKRYNRPVFCFNAMNGQMHGPYTSAMVSRLSVFAHRQRKVAYQG